MLSRSRLASDIGDLKSRCNVSFCGVLLTKGPRQLNAVVRLQLAIFKVNGYKILLKEFSLPKVSEKWSKGKEQSLFNTMTMTPTTIQE